MKIGSYFYSTILSMVCVLDSINLIFSQFFFNKFGHFQYKKYFIITWVLIHFIPNKNLAVMRFGSMIKNKSIIDKMINCTPDVNFWTTICVNFPHLRMLLYIAFKLCKILVLLTVYVWRVCLSYNSKSGLGCPDGFCGSNCSTQSQYPTYGEQWNHMCNSTEELCNHVTGCFNIKIWCILVTLNITMLIHNYTFSNSTC